MKNYIKAMVTFVFLMAAAAVMPNTASAAELATPTGVHQTDADKNNVKIVWNAVPNADTYLWSWSADGVSGWSEGKYDYSVKPETIISQLSAGTTYYVRIKAADTSDYENIQLSDWSQPIQVATAPDAAQMGRLQWQMSQLLLLRSHGHHVREQLLITFMMERQKRCWEP